eukprot:CAMPEP_0180221188 /NCGR_PEP_ID=MMETSP0987-20121128/19706_1 /TAXON_ID=697907 /ORGANISM="non described non described, Strain CCMP2293" /LENGTH=36 /DNA_ID= /DNA_START= /DNA_END= /DNA_ORIENTATION=
MPPFDTAPVGASSLPARAGGGGGEARAREGVRLARA